MKIRPGKRGGKMKEICDGYHVRPENIGNERVGFGGVLALLLIVAGLGIYSMTPGGGLFSEYRGLARTLNEVGRVQANLLDARLAGKIYLDQNSTDAAKRVRERGNAAIELAGGRPGADRAPSRTLRS
ncbi:MAG: hypothetical protein U5L06_01380 [Rhodovibrio sp.]|nr:hypothetical protein [Rhodovibrio sp.]